MAVFFEELFASPDHHRFGVFAKVFRAHFANDRPIVIAGKCQSTRLPQELTTFIWRGSVTDNITQTPNSV